MDTQSKLWNYFQNTNDWLRYAEQKNALMMTFITIQIGVFGFISRDPNTWLTLCWIILVLIALSLSFFLSAMSFLPFTNRGEFIYKNTFPFRLLCSIYKVPVGSPSNKDLILVHEDIVKYDFEGYKEKLRSYFQDEKIDNKNLELMSRMILVNARIWNIKFRFFRFALLINLGGFTLALIGLIIKLINKYWYLQQICTLGDF